MPLRPRAFVLALCAAFFCCSGCAPSYYIAPSLPRVHLFDGARVGPNTIGATYCGGDDRPVFWVRGDVARDTRALGLTLAHEDAHVAQAASIGGCRNWWAWYYTSVAHAVEAEADAFCASVRYGIKTGTFLNVLHGATYYASSLAHPDYGFGLNAAQAMQAIIDACAVRLS